MKNIERAAEFVLLMDKQLKNANCKFKLDTQR